MSNIHRRLTRREWLTSAAAAAGVAALPRFAVATMEQGGQSANAFSPKVGDKVAARLQPFPLKQVSLRGGACQQAQEVNRVYLHSIPNDRMLHTFRLNAGLPSSAEPLGGWEEPKCELRGHFAGGHFLSACALMYSSTSDEDIKDKGDAMVAELAKCQKALNADGYLSAFPLEFFDRLRDGKKVWAPFYTIHKIMAGHLDMYEHCGNTQALETVENMAGWVQKWMDPITDEHMARIQHVEFGGMNEVLYNLYAATGEGKYLALGHRFDHKKFFDPLAEGRDELKGLHVNTNIPKVIGAAREYELTGEKRYHDIADYFWHEVVSQRTYAPGGTSNGEGWDTDPGKLSQALGPAAQECCCGYNMLKLTRHVHQWTADARAMDYYERTLFNSRLGTQDGEGMKMYYLSLTPGLWKTFGTRYDAFWCCTGTGAEEFSKFGDTLYSHDGQGIYVNLFVASEVEWPERKLKLVQDTNFPEEEGTTLTVRTNSPQGMALSIRVPYWATRDVSLKINGRPEHISAQPGSYVVLDRRWADRDRVELRLPMSLHIDPTPDDHTVQAMMYGPLVLAGRLGTQGLNRDMIYGPSGPDEKSTIPVPEISGSTKNETAWVAKRGPVLEFRTVDQSSNIELIPLYKLYDERYTVYWKVNGENV